MLPTRLRAETRPDHERVEALFDITRPGVTPGEVRGWLEAFYGFYAPFESALAARDTDDLTDVVAARNKSELLARDLRHLGHTAGSLHAIPVCPTVPDVSSRAAALGALYVTEGSTLGGQLIARHLAASVPHLPPIAFFHPYGDETPAMWRRFKSLLSDPAPSAAFHDAVVRAARDTFTALHVWLAQHKPARP